MRRNLCRRNRRPAIPFTSKPCKKYEIRKKKPSCSSSPTLIPSNNLLTNQRPRPKRSSTAVSLPLLAPLLETLDVLDLGSFGCFNQKSAMLFFNFRKTHIVSYLLCNPTHPRYSRHLRRRCSTWACWLGGNRRRLRTLFRREVAWTWAWWLARLL